MNKLGIIVDFKNENLIWDDVILPMCRAVANRPNPTLNRAKIKKVMQQAVKPKVTREVIEIIVNILYSKYEKANLEYIYQ